MFFDSDKGQLISWLLRNEKLIILLAMFTSYTSVVRRAKLANYNTLSLMLQVLPVIIFLSSVVSVLFYWGVMQYIIRKMAWVMQFTMEMTAAESLNAAANIFLGMVCYVTGSTD